VLRHQHRWIWLLPGPGQGSYRRLYKRLNEANRCLVGYSGNDSVVHYPRESDDDRCKRLHESRELHLLLHCGHRFSAGWWSFNTAACNCHADLDRNCYSDADGHKHCSSDFHADVYFDCNSDADSDGYCYCYCYKNTYGDTVGDCNADLDRIGNGDPVSDAYASSTDRDPNSYCCGRRGQKLQRD
jgi:hypothetical protein